MGVCVWGGGGLVDGCVCVCGGGGGVYLRPPIAL